MRNATDGGFLAQARLRLAGPGTGGRFEILQVLGEGGMGVVFLARQKDLGRRVAIKCLRSDVLGDDVGAARFRREAQVLARLRHPDIVEVYEVGEADALVYIVSEFVEGESLRQRMARGPCPPAEACALVGAVAGALEYLHGADVVHRDLKPENVMLPAGGGVKLIDFGLARTFGGSSSSDALTRAGQVVGTPAYMAPEAIHGAPPGPGADLYALAVLLFELLAGAPPFEGPPIEVLRAHLQAPIPSIRARCPGLPALFERFFAEALAKAPSERPASAAVFRRRVERLLRGSRERTLDSTAPAPGSQDSLLASRIPSPPSPLPGPSSTRRLLPLLALGLLLVGLGAVATWGLRRGPLEPSDLVAQPLRGGLLLTWSGPCSADAVELRPVDALEDAPWTRVPLAEGRVLVSGHAPGSRHHLRFTAGSRPGPARTVTAGASALRLNGVEPPARPDAEALVSMTTVLPAVVTLRWRQGEADLGGRPLPGPATTHVWAFQPALGPVTEADALVEFPAVEPSREPLPAADLAAGLDDGLPEGLVPRLLQGVRAALTGAQLSAADAVTRTSMGRAAVAGVPGGPRVTTLLTLAPLATGSADLPMARRTALARRILAFLPPAAYGQFVYAEPLLPVEAAVKPLLRLDSREAGPAPGPTVQTLAAWEKMDEVFLPEAARDSPEVSAVLLTARLAQPDLPRPRFGPATSRVTIDPVRRGRARRLRLALTCHLFAPSYVILVTLGDQPPLPFHMGWGEIDVTRMSGTKGAVISTTTLWRDLPPELVPSGPCQVVVEARTLWEHLDDLIPQLHRLDLVMEP